MTQCQCRYAAMTYTVENSYIILPSHTWKHEKSKVGVKCFYDLIASWPLCVYKHRTI